MRTLLPKGTGQGTTGPWVFTAMGGKRAYPARVAAVNDPASVGWSGGDVIIEELIAGLPGQTNSPFGPSADSGVVETLGTIGFGGGDLLIDKPVEFIRARTDTTANGFVGQVYVGIEMLE
jgi:hypothetical protein